MVMGQGRHYATALEGSLKLSEICGVAAAAFDTEEAFHGRFHGLGGSSLALFVAARLPSTRWPPRAQRSCPTSASRAAS